MIRLCLSLFILSLLNVACGQVKAPYDKLVEVVDKINKSMPQMLDSYSRIDSLKACKPDTLMYFGAILRVNKTEENIRKIKDILENRMLLKVRTESEFKPYRDNKIKLVYNFYDENGETLFKIYLTPEKYLQ